MTPRQCNTKSPAGGSITSAPAWCAKPPYGNWPDWLANFLPHSGPQPSRAGDKGTIAARRTTAVPTLEQRTIRKVSWRLLPLIIVIYFVAYINRTIVGLGALTINKDLGLSAYFFGGGGEFFFFVFFLFEA